MKKVLYSLFLFALLSPTIYPQLDVWVQTTGTIGRVYAMVIDQSNQDIMYAGGLDQGVNKTTNGGTNWTQMNTNLLNILVQALAISRDNPLYLYAGTGAGANSGVYRTTNGGSSWTQINTGITEGTIAVQSLLVHPTNPDIAWACIWDGASDAVNGIYKTTDGGANWFPSTNGIGAIKNFLSLAMSPSDPNTLYLGSSFSPVTSTGPSAIYKSTDGGANWVLSSNGLPTDPAEINPVRTIQVSSANPNVVIAGLFVNPTPTLAGGFYVSTDAGANWTKKHNGLPADAGTLLRSSAIRPLFDNQFFVGLDGAAGNNGVWRTTDGGDNWISINGGAMVTTYAIRALVFNSTGTHILFAGCASATGNGVYEYNFSFIPVELVSFKAEVFSNNVMLSWITATETNNQGFEVERQIEGELGVGSWEKIGYVAGIGTSTQLNNYSYTDNNVAAGKYLYRLKQIDFDGSYTYMDAIEVEVLPANDYVLQQNYPNPFNPETKISFSVPISGLTTLKITDILGNEVATLLNEVIPSGSYELNFTASELPSGIYFYTLQTGDFSVTKKMVFLK